MAFLKRFTINMLPRSRREAIKNEIEKGIKNIKQSGFEPPPHINAEVHKKIMDRLRKMTPEELFQSMIKLGIYNSDGTLTDDYE